MSNEALERSNLTLSVTAGLRGHLNQVLASGLYGSTLEEAAERLLAETLKARRDEMFRTTPPHLRSVINWNPR